MENIHNVKTEELEELVEVGAPVNKLFEMLFGILGVFVLIEYGDLPAACDQTALYQCKVEYIMGRTPELDELSGSCADLMEKCSVYTNNHNTSIIQKIAGHGIAVSYRPDPQLVYAENHRLQLPPLPAFGNSTYIGEPMVFACSWLPPDFELVALLRNAFINGTHPVYNGITRLASLTSLQARLEALEDAMINILSGVTICSQPTMPMQYMGPGFEDFILIPGWCPGSNCSDYVISFDTPPDTLGQISMSKKNFTRLLGNVLETPQYNQLSSLAGYRDLCHCLNTDVNIYSCSLGSRIALLVGVGFFVLGLSEFRLFDSMGHGVGYLIRRVLVWAFLLGYPSLVASLITTNKIPGFQDYQFEQCQTSRMDEEVRVMTLLKQGWFLWSILPFVLGEMWQMFTKMCRKHHSKGSSQLTQSKVKNFKLENLSTASDMGEGNSNNFEKLQKPLLEGEDDAL
eukprot:m.71876 g.71876  ORF g.71876 m.71876 type:complete len:457 (-) comp12283_c0_seq1:109-1479(-)